MPRSKSTNRDGLYAVQKDLGGAVSLLHCVVEANGTTDWEKDETQSQIHLALGEVRERFLAVETALDAYLTDVAYRAHEAAKRSPKAVANG